MSRSDPDGAPSARRETIPAILAPGSEEEIERAANGLLVSGDPQFVEDEE